MTDNSDAADIDEIAIIFGRRIKDLRMRPPAGIPLRSQEKFATEVGLNRTYISAIEKGRRNPTFDVIIRLADALGVHPADLFAPPGHVIGNVHRLPEKSRHPRRPLH